MRTIALFHRFFFWLAKIHVHIKESFLLSFSILWQMGVRAIRLKHGYLLYFICPLVPSWASRGERVFCLRQVWRPGWVGCCGSSVFLSHPWSRSSPCFVPWHLCVVSFTSKLMRCHACQVPKPSDSQHQFSTAYNTREAAAETRLKDYKSWQLCSKDRVVNSL